MDSNNDWQEVPINKATGVPPKPPLSRDGVGESLHSRAADAPVTQGQPSKDSSAGQALLEFLTRGLKAPPDPRDPNFDKQSEQFSKNVVNGIQAGTDIGALGKGLSSAADSLGLSKIAPNLMERAVQFRKPIQGAGQELLDQGIWGTRGGMAQQIGRKLPSIEADLSGAVSKVNQPIDSVSVAGDISDLLKKKMTSDGEIVSGADDAVEAILDRAKSVASRGDVSPRSALEFARGATKNAYTLSKGELRPGLNPELAQAEGMGYKNQLKELSPDIAKSLKTQQALIEAQKALGKNPGVLSSLFNFLKFGAAGGIGSKIGGAPVAAAAGLLPTPLGLSASAHGINALGKAVKGSSDPLARLLMLQKSRNTQESLPSSNPTNSADDWQEVK